MPRTLGIVQTSIWVDEDFRALSADAQRAYLMVFSQPKITNCGVIAYVPGRLSKFAVDDSVVRLERAVSELEDARFVVVDRETQELLVRTFIRHDRVVRVEKMKLAALREFREVESVVIRRALREENPGLFDHIPEPRPPGQASLEGVIEGVDQGAPQGASEGVEEPATSARARTRAAPAPTPASKNSGGPEPKHSSAPVNRLPGAASARGLTPEEIEELTEEDLERIGTELEL